MPRLAPLPQGRKVAFGTREWCRPQGKAPKANLRLNKLTRHTALQRLRRAQYWLDRATLSKDADAGMIDMCVFHAECYLDAARNALFLLLSNDAREMEEALGLVRKYAPAGRRTRRGLMPA